MDLASNCLKMGYLAGCGAIAASATGPIGFAGGLAFGSVAYIGSKIVEPLLGKSTAKDIDKTIMKVSLGLIIAVGATMAAAPLLGLQVTVGSVCALGLTTAAIAGSVALIGCLCLGPAGILLLS